MEPRIQYAKTAGGVSIAVWALGEGLPVVQMPVGTKNPIRIWRGLTL